MKKAVDKVKYAGTAKELSGNRNVVDVGSVTKEVQKRKKVDVLNRTMSLS